MVHSHAAVRFITPACTGTRQLALRESRWPSCKAKCRVAVAHAHPNVWPKQQSEISRELKSKFKHCPRLCHVELHDAARAQCTAGRGMQLHLYMHMRAAVKRGAVPR